MAITPLALVFLGTLALFSSIAQYLNGNSIGRGLKTLIAWLGVALWGIFGLSSYSVVLETGATTSMPTMALVGFGLAALSGVQALDQTAQLIGEASGGRSSDGLISEGR